MPSTINGRLPSRNRTQSNDFVIIKATIVSLFLTLSLSPSLSLSLCLSVSLSLSLCLSVSLSLSGGRRHEGFFSRRSSVRLPCVGRLGIGQRPRRSPRCLRGGSQLAGEGERVPLQEPDQRYRLLLRPPGQPRKHQECLGIARHRRQRPPCPRPEHARRLHKPHRLRPRWAQPAPHAPPRHRDRLRPRRRTRSRLHHHRQRARLQDHQEGRGLRLPPGTRPLPEEQRSRACLRDCRLQQPAPRNAVHRHHPLRCHPAGARQRPGYGLPGGHQGRAENKGQVRAQVTGGADLNSTHQGQVSSLSDRSLLAFVTSE